MYLYIDIVRPRNLAGYSIEARRLIAVDDSKYPIAGLYAYTYKYAYVSCAGVATEASYYVVLLLQWPWQLPRNLFPAR